MAGEVAKREVAKDQELAEFAEATEAPEPADPAFREGLRERLWRLLRHQLGHEADESTSRD
ncbi:MAG: hypothetical protein ABFS41_09265 [Myxococcota bacterium]